MPGDIVHGTSYQIAFNIRQVCDPPQFVAWADGHASRQKIGILIKSKSSDHSHTNSSCWKWLIGKITSPAILFFATSGQRRDLPSPFAWKTPMFLNL